MKALLLVLLLSVGAGWVVVPGKSIGPLKQSTTRADLDGLKLPDGQLMDGSDGSEIWAMEPDKRLSVRWANPKQTRIASIFTSSKLYRTASGIGVGTRLSELAKRNGADIQFSNFGADPPGAITSWGQGKLAREFKGLQLTLTWRTPRYSALSGPEKESLEQQAGGFSSSSAVARKLDPTVKSMTLTF